MQATQATVSVCLHCCVGVTNETFKELILWFSHLQDVQNIWINDPNPSLECKRHQQYYLISWILCTKCPPWQHPRNKNSLAQQMFRNPQMQNLRQGWTGVSKQKEPLMSFTTQISFCRSHSVASFAPGCCWLMPSHLRSIQQQRHARQSQHFSSGLVTEKTGVDTALSFHLPFCI